jgi:hypothetical protein
MEKISKSLRQYLLESEKKRLQNLQIVIKKNNNPYDFLNKSKNIRGI